MSNPSGSGFIKRRSGIDFSDLKEEIARLSPEAKKGWLSESLMKAVQEGDCDKVRHFFDHMFWHNEHVPAEWRHLKFAMQQENLPMMKLLVIWGAKVDEIELREMRHLVQYPRYIKALRQSGIRAPLPEWMPSANQDGTEGEGLLFLKRLLDEVKKNGIEICSVVSVPKEWLKVLAAVQEAGAGEAVIAGGALRDLFNQKEVKDVDIFLLSRGSERKNKKFLEEVFKAVGLFVIEQFDGRGDTGTYRKFMDPHRGGMGLLKSVGYGLSEHAVKVEAWKVLATPDAFTNPVEYNIVFLEGFDKRDLHNIKVTNGISFKHKVLDMFDIGLCCIATDGKGIYTTTDYNDDVKNKTITLLTNNSSSKNHLERIVKKYPDWTLCEKSKRLLGEARNTRKFDIDFY